jgi:hypothetical protein
MDWHMWTVISAIVVAVSAALWVIFSTSKDSYTYHRHYTRNGFEPDLPEDRFRFGRNG